ncbi:hypothetical protein KJ742_01560 [Patescibacteria group bacterium]|nr:hypothetical protein [Patescibacteria group bacterium]MBU1682611.1 hypothetical protein [Patescibacteria group bacterium]MBU1934542.1 hypothetical protein [Patescibacteria group bacterium]
MGNFNKGGGGRFDSRGGGRSFGGGGRSFGGGGGRGGFGGNRPRPEMHKAVCDECGSKCEVPFKPSGDKPVLCSECFGGSGGRDRGGRDARSRVRGGGDRGDRQMYKATCAECGNRCEVPFRPSGDKPVLCSECFGGGGGGKSTPSGPGQSPISGAKHDEILAKLDKILALLQRTNPVKEVTVMKEKKEKKQSDIGAQDLASKEKEDVKPKKAAPKAKAKATTKKAPAKKKTVKKAPLSGTKKK